MCRIVDARHIENSNCIQPWKILGKFCYFMLFRTATQRFVYTKRDVIFCDGIYLIVVNIVPIIIDA